MHSLVILFICFWLIREVTETMGESFASIYETTPSTIRIIWNTPRITNDPEMERSIFSLDFRSEDDVYTPASLERDNTSSIQLHIVKEPRKLAQDVGKWSKSPIWVEMVNQTAIKIAVSELKYPDCVYSFNMSRTLGDITENISVFARTQFIPPNTTKLGLGAFHIFENNVKEGRRKVKVFLPPKLGTRRYLVRVYLDNYVELIHATEVSPKEGWLVLDIGSKAHLVEIRLTIREWMSKECIRLSIPSQENVLPTFSGKIHSKGERDKIYTTMEWEIPENINVSNYTIFWLDSPPDVSTSHRILDFEYVSRDTHSFQVFGTHVEFLGLSVNTESMSSGIQLPRWS